MTKDTPGYQANANTGMSKHQNGHAQDVSQGQEDGQRITTTSQVNASITT